MDRRLAALLAVAFAISCGGPAAAPASSAPPKPSATAAAASPTKAPLVYSKIGTINLPTQSGSFDVALVDSKTHTLYLADRTNKGVSVIVNEKYVRTIGGMVGVGKTSDVSGPNGLILVPDLNQLWAGDGDSTVKVIDLNTNAIIASISTGGKGRADEGAYDPKHKIVMIGNDSEEKPFVTFISTTDRKVLGKLEIPGAGGVEEPEFDEANGVFWLSVPMTKTNPGGEIDVIDPVTMKITKTYPLKDCRSTGLVFGPKTEMLVVCGNDAIKAGFKAQMQFMDRSNGSIIGTVDVGGGDLVVYDESANVYFAADSNMTADGTKDGAPNPVLAIVDGATHKVLQTIPTKRSAHIVAIDTSNHHVYVPIPDEGIAIIAAAGQ
jgi:DNA-binding beta-propeller fold protein YncE